MEQTGRPGYDDMNAMTKSGLIEAVAARMPNLLQRDIEVVINTMFDTMTHALVVGDRIEIRGLGSFSVRHRRARQGRNPKTGELIEVPAKRVPFFTVGHELRQRVNDGRTDGGPGETSTVSQPGAARVSDLAQAEAGSPASERESAAS